MLVWFTEEERRENPGGPELVDIGGGE